MKTITQDELERTRVALELQRPVRVQDIDFNNPYFTQPRTAARERDSDVIQQLRGTQVPHVYVHVPFCATRCRYCHYPTVSNLHTPKNQEQFVRQLEQETRQYVDGGLDFSAVRTVHVGGGTPNTLNDANLARLLSMLQDTFKPSQEFAVEVYPAVADLTEDKFRMMRDLGVDRLSIGVQTFDDAVNEQNRRINQERHTVVPLIGLAQQDATTSHSTCSTASEGRT